MADAVFHTLSETTTHIKTSAGAGKILPITRFLQKSLILLVTGAGDYDIQVSNSVSGPWVDISTNLVAGASPHLITTEHGATNRMPDKVGFLQIVTNVFESGDNGIFLGEDPH